jgi:hypothetical protein
MTIAYVQYVSAFPVNRHGAQHTPIVRPPFTFGFNLQPGFEISPRARAGPRAAALADEGVGLSGELVSAQQAVVLLPEPCHGPVDAISPSTTRL